MKMRRNFLLTTFILSFSITVFAQQKEQMVKFANGGFITGSNISKQTFKKEAVGFSKFGDSYFVLLQFSSLPSKAVQQQLKNNGITLGSYLPGNAYVASVKSSFNFAGAKSFNIVSINTIPSFYKIDKRLINYTPDKTKKETQLFAVNYFSSIDNSTVKEELRKAGAIVTEIKFNSPGVIYIQPDKTIINAVAALPFVNSIMLQSVKDKPLNYNTVGLLGTGGLNAATGKNLNGKGVTVGIGDNADISTHIDFAGRLINRTAFAPSQHGTHVAGTMAGAGIVNVKHHGMAPKATIVNQFFSDIITNSPAYITDHNLVLTNNSYYTVEDGCPGNGNYDELSNYADNQMLQYEQLLHVTASGNDGSQTCNPFPASFGTVKSGWQAAKNTLTIGSISSQDFSISSFSSRGPLNDGRIKPELVTPGWAIVSTNTNNAYATMWGTSMASPSATGSLALMYERYRQLHGGANPKSSLMKALACNTAEDIGNAGPDYTFGFGIMNTRRAIEAIDSNRYVISSISNNGNNNHNITLPAGARRLKIMLYWADRAAAPNAASALVNNLDLRVVTPSTAVRQPLILNADPAHITDLAAEGTDNTNNAEQVTIENPAAGNYTINVNGTAVPFGPQEYIITYEIVQPSVTVEYPFGGETFVPGETENIRWVAYGNDANSFTIEYSINNGSSWLPIDNNVPAASRIYAWAVPASVTNTALIRISRNGTALTGQSAKNFVILGQPVVTTTKVCEGAVQLNWSAITSATGYDILQLTGDSMKVIGNTASTSYLITGLNKYNTYWFGVAAKNNTVSGRRSLSVSVVPNSGSCTLAAFTNDIKVDSILEPNTARQQFANAANATKPVKVSIKNLGTTTVTGPYDVSFSYAGNTITETVNTTINAGGTLIYTFTGNYNIISSGYKYDFKAWATKSSDGNHLNDTAYKTVKYINNDAITALPLTEDFEQMPAAEFTSKEMAAGDNNHLDFSANTARGRARTFVNSGFALSGNRALTLDQFPLTSIANTDSATFSYNLQLFNTKQLRFDFYYKNHGQIADTNNKVWIRGSENNKWVQAYDLYSNQAALGNWKKGIININEVLGNAVPAQTASQTFQIKMGEQGYTSANNAYPEIDIDDGYTFDDLKLSEAVNDVAATQIISPDKGGCSLSANTPVSVKIKNYNNATLNNLSVSYQVNGGAIVTETIASIAANQTTDYVFNQTADFSAYTGYTLNVWVKYAGDTYSANDSLINYTFYSSPVISSYPYTEDFENSDGFFYTNGTNSTWQWGTPVTPLKKLITKTASGSNAWITNLSGNHVNNETSYLVTPCFNLSNLSNPVLSFSHTYDLEEGYDYSWVEYSTDGINWVKLGTFNEGTNWYNDNTTNSWNNTNTIWHVASFDIPVTGTSMHFRFVMSSDGGVTQEGIGIDDVRVFGKSSIDVFPFPMPVSSNVAGNNWISFVYGDPLLLPWQIEGEINAHGQNLGQVTIQPHHNKSGVVRYSNNLYYLDKSFEIKSTNPVSGPVDIRLYFTDAAVNALLNSTECNSCEKPGDAYEFGVTHYKGSASEEDGSLANNNDGYYQLITPANVKIVPHDNGYYAEFTVNSLGEFWFSKNNIEPAVTKNCSGDIVIYTTVAGASSYQWQVNTGSGYTNISNGVNYSGSSTDSLQIINTPVSFAGYKYRCLINGSTADIEYTLRLKNIWTGTINTDWFTPINWNCGTVPDQNTDVIIPTGLTNYPVINANTSVRNIKVQPGASCNILPGIVFDVKGQ